MIKADVWSMHKFINCLDTILPRLGMFKSVLLIQSGIEFVRKFQWIALNVQLSGSFTFI